MTTTTDQHWLELADAPAIEGLRFRRPRGDDDDFEAMARVIHAANAHDEIPWRPSATNLREELEGSSRCDPATDIVLAELNGRVMASAGADRVVRDGIATYELWGHVVPELRRRGLGTALLRENLRRMDERGAAEPDGQRVEPRAFVEDTEAGHRAILTAAGLEPIRYFFLMLRPTLDDIPATPLPDGLKIRPVSADQHRAIFDAENEAFRDHWQAAEHTDDDFDQVFRKSDLRTDLWVVAWEGDEVAAVVQNWIWTDENASLGVSRGWLEKISVRRAWRRRGLGRAVTAEALRRLRDAGMSEGMLGVDAENPSGALGLYEGLGFEVHQRAAAYGPHKPRSGE